MFLDKLDSKAIKSLLIEDNVCTIVFNSSEKEYKYNVIDKEFVNSITNCLTNKNSIGSLVNKSIKNESIVQLNTTTI